MDTTESGEYPDFEDKTGRFEEEEDGGGDGDYDGPEVMTFKKLDYDNYDYDR